MEPVEIPLEPMSISLVIVPTRMVGLDIIAICLLWIIVWVIRICVEVQASVFLRIIRIRSTGNVFVALVTLAKNVNLLQLLASNAQTTA